MSLDIVVLKDWRVKTSFILHFPPSTPQDLRFVAPAGPSSYVPVMKVDGKAQVRPSHIGDPGHLVDKQYRVRRQAALEGHHLN